MTPRDGNRSYDDVLAHVAAKRRKRRSRERRNGRRSAMATLVLLLVFVVMALLVSGAVAGAIYVHGVLTGVSLDTLEADPPGINSQIYDRDGHLLETISSTENRTPVKASQISPWLKIATVDVEDKRFWHHGGLDYPGIIRAALDNLQAGQITQGASTLEQQLVRNLYLSDEQSATRKIREAWLATQMADEWSKRKILTEYLNVVPYGAVTYGCQAAALRYFDRPCSKLTIKQAALLAGLPQNPITYNPLSNKAAARARRNEVLAAMLSAGHITQAQYDTASSSKLGTHPGRYLDQTGGDEGYFVSWVRQTLEEKLGRNTVKKGGLAIHTTLDPRLQAAAHTTLRNMMSWSGAPAAALVSIDPRDGQVLAMDASVPFSKTSQFNIPAEAYRQVGSTFKMFTLVTSIADGYNPNTTSELSAHLSYTFPNTALGPSNPWVVDTASDSEELNAPRTIADATAQSDNTVFARLAIDLGAPSIVNTAHKMGIPKSVKLAPYPSITLGVSPVSPLWMAAAYSTLADERRSPRAPVRDQHRQHRLGPHADDQQAAGQARAVGRRRLRGQQGAGGADLLRHRRRHGAVPRRPRRGRQDRHHQRLQGRLVLRLHAQPHDLRVDGLSQGRDHPHQPERPHAVRRRHPGHDLAHLHGAGVRARAEEVPGGLRLAAAQAPRPVGAVPLAVPHLRALHGQVQPQDHQGRWRR